VVRENLKLTGLADRAEILQTDAFTHLAGVADRRFDYVYIAPPQYKGMWRRALLALDERPSWLVDDGWAIVQIHPVEFEPLPLKNLIEFDQRRYGSTLLVFYRLTDVQEPK